jgi:hypothetical protein
MGSEAVPSGGTLIKFQRTLPPQTSGLIISCVWQERLILGLAEPSQWKWHKRKSTDKQH